MNSPALEQESDSLLSLDLRHSIQYGSTPQGHATTPAPGYSLLRVRLVTAAVTLLLGWTPSITLVSQYLVHRLKEEGDFVNFSMANFSECNSAPDDSRVLEIDALQARVSTYLLYFNYTANFPALLTCLVLGGVTDYLGRRVTLALPMFGLTIKLILVACITRFRLSIWIFFIAYAVEGVFGTGAALRVALFSTMADSHQGKQARILWIVIFNSLANITQAGSNITIGFLIKQFGFFPSALVMATAMFLAFLTPLLFLPETLPSLDVRQCTDIEKLEEKLVQAQVKVENTAFTVIKQMNPVKTLRRAYGLFSLVGSLRRKMTFVISLLIFFLAVNNDLSMAAIDTLYQLHHPFSWDSQLIGYHSAMKTGGQNLLGMLLLMGLQLCVREDRIGTVSSLFQAASYVLEAFANTTWQLFLVPLVGIPGCLITSIVRGLMSVLAGPNNQGAVFTSLAFIEITCQIVANSALNRIYAETVTTFPGEVFLVMASFSMVVFILFI